MLPTKFRFIWPSGFGGENLFLNRPIRNKNCPWQPCLLMDRDEMSKLYRGPSIDASYQVSVFHLAEGFQRRLKCEKLTDNRRRTPSDGKSSHCLWQGQLKRIKEQNIMQKTKDRATRTPLRTKGELRCSRRVSNYCSTNGIAIVHLKNTKQSNNEN